MNILRKMSVSMMTSGGKAHRMSTDHKVVETEIASALVESHAEITSRTWFHRVSSEKERRQRGQG